MPEICSGAHLIPNGIKIIAGGAFLRCGRLTSIIIPNITTDIKYAAFNNRTTLESIQIPNSVKYVEELVFAGCNSLITPLYNKNIFFLYTKILFRDIYPYSGYKRNRQCRCPSMRQINLCCTP